jgi:predicted DNA-binding transcriptional regulator YafY
MLNTVLRQIEILKCLPRHPRKIAVTGIHAKLKDAGHDVTVRTIQRDLLTLSGVFAITGDDQKPQGWSWTGDPLQIPALDPQGALTLKLAQMFLAPMMPKATLNALDSHFQAAEGVLKASPKLAKWTNKVRVLPKGLALNPPKIDPEVQSAVYEAMLWEKQVFMHYRRKGESELKKYTVNPLGIVIRDQVIYLICTLWEYEDVLQLAMHRIVDAQILDKHARLPKGFDLDAYIRSGELGYLASEIPIRLSVSMDEGAAQHLYETPLSSEQVLTPQHDGCVLLEATVLDTSELRWWLLGFGSSIEVLMPKKLRKEFQSMARGMANLYK